MSNDNQHLKVNKKEKKQIKRALIDHFMDTIDNLTSEETQESQPSPEMMRKRREAICEIQEIDRKMIKYALQEYIRCKNIIEYHRLEQE